ncbi:MAG: HNH endonuclease [Coleofasciculus sp. C1-SOL-03]
MPRSAGGETVFDNLCLACPTCNRYKATRQTVPDPLTGESVALFHPLHSLSNPLLFSNRRKCTRPDAPAATMVNPSGAIAQQFIPLSPVKFAITSF